MDFVFPHHFSPFVVNIFSKLELNPLKMILLYWSIPAEQIDTRLGHVERISVRQEGKIGWLVRVC